MLSRRLKYDVINKSNSRLKLPLDLGYFSSESISRPNLENRLWVIIHDSWNISPLWWSRENSFISLRNSQNEFHWKYFTTSSGTLMVFWCIQWPKLGLGGLFTINCLASTLHKMCWLSLLHIQNAHYRHVPTLVQFWWTPLEGILLHWLRGNEWRSFGL